MNINELPPELLVNIFQYLDQESLLFNVSHICRYWYHVTKSVSLWHYVDMNRLVIKRKKRELNVIQRISEFSLNIQHLKISPILLVELDSFCKGHGEQLKNLRKLELIPSRITSADIFQLVRRTCPNLKTLKFKFSSDQTSVLQSAFHDLNVEEICLDHEICGREQHWSLEEKLSTTLYELEQEISRTKRLTIRSSSYAFISFILEKTLPLVTCLDAFGVVLSNSDTLNITSVTATMLTELRLDFARVSDRVLIRIAESSPNLKILSLLSCKSITDRGVSMATKSCHKLERLLLRNSMTSEVTYGDQSLPSISLFAVSDDCVSLRMLLAQNLKRFDDVKLSKIICSCRLLTSLSLCTCPLLSDSSLEVIAQNCSMLKSADFSQCPEITFNGVWKIMSGCIDILSLSLVACDGLVSVVSSIQTRENETETTTVSVQNTDQLHSVVADLPHSKIHTLNMAYCCNLDPTSLKMISEKCKDLRTLILRFGGNKMETINSDILQAVFSNCTYLQAILVGFNDAIDREETGKKIDKDCHYPSWRLGMGLFHDNA